MADLKGEGRVVGGAAADHELGLLTCGLLLFVTLPAFGELAAGSGGKSEEEGEALVLLFCFWPRAVFSGYRRRK